MPKIKAAIANITGRKFGRLTVLFPTEKRDHIGSVYWHCRCECGNELDVTQSNLVYGNYRSCGCLKKELQQNVQSQLHILDGTCVEWLKSRKYRSDNTSGFRGVYKVKNGRYRVCVGFKNKRYYFGQYADYNTAVQVRTDAEEIIHGGFLRAYEIWKEQKERYADSEEVPPLIYEVSVDNKVIQITTNISIKRRKILEDAITLYENCC